MTNKNAFNICPFTKFLGKIMAAKEELQGTPRQTFRIDEYVWKKFQKKCQAKGFSASDVLRAFIARVLDGSINVESVKPSRGVKGEQLEDYVSAFQKWLKKNS